MPKCHVSNNFPTCDVPGNIFFFLCIILLLTFSAHAPEGYSIHLVGRSVDLSTSHLSDRLVLNLE